MTSGLCFVLLLATLMLKSGSAEVFNNTIPTTHGLIRGLTEKVEIWGGAKVDVDVFWGIPFAKAPVGDRRFQNPVPSDPWTGTFQATKKPNSCVQVLQPNPLLIGNPPTPLSEDCLYLNIWRPRCSGSSAMATMFWIHSGMFTTGSSTIDSFNGSRLAASNCVIVVSTNYRVGALGFLYLDTREVQGNMGLLDVIESLKWINNNLIYFGGDPCKITLFGMDAGGSIASLLLFSPQTRDLFNNVIIQSGSPFSRFAWQSKELALEASKQFASAVNCTSKNITEIVKCLKQVDAKTLALQHLSLIMDFTHAMVGVANDLFLGQGPFQALKSKSFKRTPIMIGSNYGLGAWIMSILWPQEYGQDAKARYLTRQEMEDKLEEVFKEIFKPEFVQTVLSSVRNIYGLNRNETYFITYLGIIIGDALTVCPTRLLAKAYANVSQDVYLYSFEYKARSATWSPWASAILSAEIPFIFGNPTAAISSLTPRELEISHIIMKYWTNFAKYGDPSHGEYDLPVWLKYGGSDPSNILKFSPLYYTENGQIKQDPYISDHALSETRGCNYWNNLPDNYYII